MKKPENNINLLSTAIDNAQFMLIIFDPELNTLQINEAFQKITGWTVESVKDTDLVKACFPDPKIQNEVVEFMRREKQGWRLNPSHLDSKCFLGIFFCKHSCRFRSKSVSFQKMNKDC